MNSQEEFLERNGISKDDWDKSQCDWPTLVAIGEDHENNAPRLRESATLFSNVIQKFKGVHSVRWRVKETDRLIKKIIRKRVDGSEKYKNIDDSNYFEIVTDLVGLRALHLFKDDCFDIDSQIRKNLLLVENTVAYIRDGDEDTLRKRFEERGFEIKSHPAGYRSVHYVFKSQPFNRNVITEVQVRTIFEEGWSEIDHKVRYPDLNSSELVAYFLTIFNRMAGSADEMGGFVRGLSHQLDLYERQVKAETVEKESALSAVEATVGELEKLKQEDLESKQLVSKLREEIDRLKRSEASPVYFKTPGLGALNINDGSNIAFLNEQVKKFDNLNLSKAARELESAMGGLGALSRIAKDKVKF